MSNRKMLTTDEVKAMLDSPAKYHGKDYKICGVGFSILGISLLLQSEKETLYLPMNLVTVGNNEDQAQEKQVIQ